MKFVTRLTDDELKELFKKFSPSKGKIKKLKIKKDNKGILLKGILKFPVSLLDKKPELRKIAVEKDGYFEVSYNFRLTDFDAKEICFDNLVLAPESKIDTILYREYMYEKFGSEYSEEYLFSTTELCKLCCKFRQPE
jgi:hypothetical protein